MLHIYSGKGNLLFFLQLRTTIWDSSHHIRFHPKMLSKNILVRSQVDHLVLMSWWGAAFTYRGLPGNQGSGESQHASFSRKVQSHFLGWLWGYQLTQVVHDHDHDKRNQNIWNFLLGCLRLSEKGPRTWFLKRFQICRHLRKHRRVQLICRQIQLKRYIFTSCIATFVVETSWTEKI